MSGRAEKLRVLFSVSQQKRFANAVGNRFDADIRNCEEGQTAAK